MSEKFFMCTSLAAGICLVFAIGELLKLVMYVLSHLTVVWN